MRGLYGRNTEVKTRCPHTLNLTNCLASYGVPFNIGETRQFSFWGVSQPTGGALNIQTWAKAASQVIFRRVG